MFGPGDFLKNFKDSVIQTFDDREYTEKDPSLIYVCRSSEVDWLKLRELNARGAGIFFSVNQFSGGKRGKELCTGINSWFVECDTLTKDEQWKLVNSSPLPPSAIIESKKSLHVYWFAKSGTVENFVKIQQGLIEHFSGDPTGKDIARVLRIPTFLHNKTMEPVVVEAQHVGDDMLYTEEQMLKAFPAKQEPLKPLPPPSGATSMTPARSNFWDDLSKLDNREVLRKMSGQDICNKEMITFTKRNANTDHIVVNGKPCDAWIDENGLIGSGKGGGPTWMQWLSFYGRSKAEIAKWAQDNLLDMLSSTTVAEVTKYRQNIPKADTVKPEAKKIRVTTAMEHLKAIIEDFKAPPSEITWGLPKLDTYLPAIENGHYVILFGQQGSGKTLYAFYMARKNAMIMDNVVFLSLEMSTAQLLKRYVRDRGQVGKELYRSRIFNFDIADKYLPELKGMKFAGIDEGMTYGVKEVEEIIKQCQPKMLFIDNLNKLQGAGRGELEVTQSVSQGLLGLTRQYKIPIIVIHHANKMVQEKSRKKAEEPTPMGVGGRYDETKATTFRGLAGMRGTNKTADDADIIVEIARTRVIPNPNAVVQEPIENSMTGIAVYKDREFDALGKQWILYHEGAYYESVNDVNSEKLLEKSVKKEPPV